jgi:intracellular multiplication protein IcmL
LASEELDIVRLRNDFYRDGFYKIFIVLMMLIIAFGLLVATSAYLFFTKPPPVSFYTDNDLRAFPPVPITEPYVKQADLIQWASEILPKAFTFDFINYNTELKALQQYFTDKGWASLLTQLNTYANANIIQTAKLFVNASAGGAPTIPNQGMLNGRYAWWVQIPLTLHRVTVARHDEMALTVQALVIRVPTLNNLSGIVIDNLVVQAVGQKQGQEAAGQTGLH